MGKEAHLHDRCQILNACEFLHLQTNPVQEMIIPALTVSSTHSMECVCKFCSYQLSRCVLMYLHGSQSISLIGNILTMKEIVLSD